MKHAILNTEDGSSTLYNELVDDTYHSIHGAITESKMVYVENGFCYASNFEKKEIKIFEVGFGTGLNALLTASECCKRKIKVHYHSVEAFPLDTSILQNLNYSEFLEKDECDSLLANIQFCNWNEEVKINDYYSLYKEFAKLEDCEIPLNFYNVVYYDAFGPSKQPEMWSFELIEKICLGIKQNGVFVTYSTKGELKRMLVKLGFKVEKLQGPLGKREVLRAIKI